MLYFNYCVKFPIVMRYTADLNLQVNMYIKKINGKCCMKISSITRITFHLTTTQNSKKNIFKLERIVLIKFMTLIGDRNWYRVPYSSAKPIHIVANKH